MRRLAHDLGQSARSLARAPLFTAVAVVSLGLALALNTSLFALADGILHPPVPYPDPQRIVVPTFFGGDAKHALTIDLRFRMIRDGLHSYDRISSYTFLRGAVVQASNTEEYRSAVGVDGAFFEVLGVRPMFGRTFGRAEVSAGATQSAIISYRLWNRLYRDRSLAEAPTIDVSRTRYTIIGVMPRGFHFPYDLVDIWLPVEAMPADALGRAFGPIPVMHLRAGVSIDAMQSDLTVLAARLSREFTPKHPLYGRVMTLGSDYASPTVFPGFVIMTVAMVLVIASANLATMLVARGMARRRDTAIRVALGARRRDVVRGVLAECGLIVGVGVTLGMLLTWWALYVLPHFAVPMVPDLGDLQPVPSWRVFAFALVVAMVTIIAAGILPAFRSATVDPSEPMKEGAGTTTGRVRDRYNILIVVEVALSTALLMCAGLFIVVSVRLAAFDFRYAAKQLVTLDDVPLDGQHIPKAAIAKTYDDVIGRLAHLPHVRSAATVHYAIPGGKTMLGENGRAGDHWLNANSYAVVSPSYFQTMGLSVVRGRDFMPGDALGEQPVAIVDQRAVARLWPDTPDPVGRMIKLGGRESTAPWVRVIGVVDSIEFLPRNDLDLPPEPGIYLVQPNDATADRALIVRGDGADGDRGRTQLSLALAREIDAVLPSLHHVTFRPWLFVYERERSTSGFMAGLFGAFALFGLILCTVGLYGVLSYTVSRRQREFGVRVALGARRRDVLRVVVHDAVVMALAGVGIGAFVALKLTRPIIDLLAGYPYAAVTALVGGELVLFAAALIAALGPLRQAAKADPIEVLRAA